MEILSNADGSAHAVREAAASESSEARLALERELDRLNDALAAQTQAAAQHANWTLLAQAFLLTSYLIVLVGGWSAPIPGKRWLLAAVAGYAMLSLVLGTLAQRGARDRIGPLRTSRKLAEQALERVAGRPTVFSRDRTLAAIVGEWAARLLPLVILLGWSSLAVYTLGVRFTSEAPAPEARTSAPLPTPATPVARAKGPATPVAPAKSAPRNTEEKPAAAPAPASPAEDAESPLAALLRRAINTPPAEQGDAVKP